MTGMNIYPTFYLPTVKFPRSPLEFPPFEMLFGWRVRGLLDIVKETWIGEMEKAVPVVACVVEMQDHLQQITNLVWINTEKAQ